MACELKLYFKKRMIEYESPLLPLFGPIYEPYQAKALTENKNYYNILNPFPSLMENVTRKS